MHLTALVRGPRYNIERWIDEMGAIKMPFEIKSDKTLKGLKKGNYSCQMNVQTIQLLDFVFPEGEKDNILNTIFGKGGPNPNHKWHGKAVNIIRKLLGMEKVPEDYSNDKIYPIAQPLASEIIGVGLKEDGHFEDGTEKL